MKANEITITNPLITGDHLRRKAVIYLRQSTMEQVRHNSGSTDFQKMQAELARQYGWPDHLIQVVDEDLGRSGSSIVGRSGWKALLDDIAANLVGAVFAANISRLSRQLLDFETFRVLAAYHKVLLITDGRVIDQSDSNDTVLAQVSATIFQFENRKRAEVMRQARFTKARQGVIVSQLPAGWARWKIPARSRGKGRYRSRHRNVLEDTNAARHGPCAGPGRGQDSVTAPQSA